MRFVSSVRIAGKGERRLIDWHKEHGHQGKGISVDSARRSAERTMRLLSVPRVWIKSVPRVWIKSVPRVWIKSVPRVWVKAEFSKIVTSGA
jgi:hypothetical protein